MSDNLKWNFEEFTSFLLLYASNADLEISEDEIALIQKRVTVKQYTALKAIFDQQSDYERIQTILSFRGLYFPTEARARELMDMVTNLFNVDGHFSRLEQNSLRILKRLI